MPGGEDETAVYNDVGGFEGGGHIGAFANCHTAVLYKQFSVVLKQLVLGGAGKCDVAVYAPNASALGVFCVAVIIEIFLDSAALNFFDLLTAARSMPFSS